MVSKRSRVQFSTGALPKFKPCHTIMNMTQVLEQQLFRLHGLRNNWAEVELTPEEASKITRHSDGHYSTGNLGYFDPGKVRRYFVEELDRIFRGSPHPVIYIRAEDDWRYSRIGTYELVHREGSESYGVIFSPVLKGDQIDVQYVVDDESGKFVPVTREKVEGEIRDAYVDIDQDRGVDFHRIENLAKASGLDFADEIGKLERRFEEAEFNRYNAPEHLRKVIEELNGALRDRYVSLGHLSGSGTVETLDEFLGRLPTLTIPEDLKPVIPEIIGGYLRAYDNAIAVEQETISEKQEKIERLQAEKARIRRDYVYAPLDTA